MADATALAAAIAAGETSAHAAMTAALEAAERHAWLGALTRIEAECALGAARRADTAPAAARGPLHGVPFPGKDLGSAAAGMATAAGSPALRRRMADPDEDSALFGRFRAAGLIPFGLTTAPEFGLALTSEPPGAPPARNPWNTSLSPGGSSGGAAAAVAAGIAAIAHATDAAGSIRVPAACCGLVGLKPTRGATPGGPGFFNHLLGIVGELVLARTVRDVATAFAAAGGDARGPCPDAAPVGFGDRVRVGLAIPGNCAPAVEERTRAAARALEDLGAAIEPLGSIDTLGADAHKVAGTILTASLADWLAIMDIGCDEVTPITAAFAEQGRTMGAAELFAASRALARVSHRAWALFDACDVILMPVLSGPPPAIGAFDPQATDPAARLAQMAALAPNVSLANVAGLPALALPFGLDDGLPVGVQLLGPMGSDAALLGLGARLEAVAPALTFPFAVAGLP
ncbi:MULTISPECIES: amidase [unclassified Roseitalea]|uniref:amidase n=1 Tax=unclassified Roseitalea TaxID=2639107 RepID=UPI00273E2A7E|nr:MULTISPECIES: amidase [unclassified Roseitalea]